MKRREFITLIGSTAACWPLVAFARQSERVRRIGVLAAGGLDADDLDMQTRIGAFEEGLQQLGWVEAKTFGSTFVRAQEMPTVFADMRRN